MIPSVTILTIIPSPYQVEFFDALAASGHVQLRIIYLYRRAEERFWNCPLLHHEHLVYNDGSHVAPTAIEWVENSDLVVFSWYSDRAARILMRRRVECGRRWALWGERPRTKWGFFGRMRRRAYLRPLVLSSVPIWGIGKWAVQGWQKEFGCERTYENVPYFSDLSRFARGTRLPNRGTRTILFSGSMSRRKGIDLLADAFLRVARAYPILQLDILGTGELESMVRARLDSVRDRVRFLGFQQWDRLPEFYRAADVLCAPSRYDGWGMIVPEALAAGLPVIATNRTGAAIDLVRPGVNGWMIPASNDIELENALRQVAEMTDEQLGTMSRAAVAAVNAHTLQDGVRRFCDAVTSALEFRV